MINTISNEQVLQTIFGAHYQYAHVTSFTDDPSSITNDRKAICWAGDYYINQPLLPRSNQFFAVSLFSHDEGRSRRRKSHFAGTYVIGLDDVNEKLPPEMVARLPQPTYKMNSSLNSEQWFYVLQQPEMNANRVDNLLDQLIANGLAPDGNDPGMKGVTRYLRLPEGVNTKAKRMAENGGIPYQCVITDWHPERKFTMEQLAIPFNVNLDADRREVRTSGTVEIPDHPIVKLFNVKSTLGAGKYDVTCPWISDHTDGDDSGTALFTNDDGSIGFHCHHGHCESKTATDVLRHLGEQHAGIEVKYRSWRNHYQSMNAFNKVNKPSYDFMGIANKPATQVVSYDFMGSSTPEKKSDGFIDYQEMMNVLRRELPQSEGQMITCEQFLHTIDPLPYAQKMKWYAEIQQVMGWGKSDMTKVIDSWRRGWYNDTKADLEIYKDIVFVTSLNQFYDPIKGISYSVEGFHNMYSHIDEEARKTALVAGKVRKVDQADYVPGKPPFFEEGGKQFANSWTGDVEYGEFGDCTAWLSHWDKLGWSEFRDTHLKFMANTIRRPETKINWAVLMAGREGTGKDFLLYPLMKALGRNSGTTDGASLLGDFNEYLLNKKHIHFNEVELGDHIKNREIANKLKPIIAAPPNRIDLNIKNLRIGSVKNVASVTITSNHYQPLYTDRGSRRYFMTWTDLNPRDENNEMKPEWIRYWNALWLWMMDPEDMIGGQGGWKQCVYHLVHHVDLSSFNPGTAPPITDYMREVQEMSKSPLELEIETLIEDKVGAFAHDLITTNEAMMTIKMHGNNQRVITPSVLAKLLSTIGCRSGLRCTIDNKQMRLIALRNTDYYATIDSFDLAQEYIRQHQNSAVQGNVVSFK